MLRDGSAGAAGLSLHGGDDTIVALATAPGHGALAVIRLSGARAHEIARTIVVAWPTEARAAVLSAIIDPHTGHLLDQAIVVRHDAPRSYTGEHLVEITSHGGVVVPTTIIAALIDQGARQALPGEFTRRAVLNGKLDMMQAEAVSDLVDARSRRAQTVALAQLDGGLSRRIASLRDALIGIEALIAYDIDFPEEDDGPVATERITDACDVTIAALEALRSTAAAGELVRDGAVVVLAGAPNVGKSSLFNALLGQPRAIVTDLPGTTRDALEATIDASGWALRLIDTAGLRETTDRIERLGIEVSERYMARAAVILACGDTPGAVSAAVSWIRDRSSAPIIAVRTKTDVAVPNGLVSQSYELRRGNDVRGPIAVSAEEGSGLPDLLDAIIATLSEQVGSGIALDAPILTRARHRRAIDESLAELQLFRSRWVERALPAPVAATHLRSAVMVLETLIGVVDVDDVLDQVFSTFCVGK